MTTGPFLRLDDISRTYPGVLALDRVSMEVGRGEIVGLVGENGAGKSTLLKILGGVIEPSTGSITLDGVAHRRLTVAESMAAGIGFVHQELNLFDNLDAGANLFIGREPLRGGPLKLIDRKRLRAMADERLAALGVDFRSETPVSSLSIAQRQLLEIARALSMEARLLILDEPTSSLTLDETARLIRVVQQLKSEGVAIVFVTHRLNEIVGCADRVMVLRDGRTVGALAKAEITHAAMIRLMIGRDLKSLYTAPLRSPGPAVLEISGARTHAWPSQETSLEIRSGEILGIAGLIGAGRTELARAVFGVDRLCSGQIRLDGALLSPGDPRAAIARGLYLVPEDRKRSGVVLDLPIAENIVLPDLTSHARSGLVRRSAIRACAMRQKNALDIRAPGVDVPAGSLSGGNQQKVALAKWLALAPRVLICDEPTRGVDVGAKQEIYAILRRLADSGVAVVMISSDMEEVIGVSDRIAVMREGAISGFLDRADFSEHNVLRLAVGETAEPVGNTARAC